MSIYEIQFLNRKKENVTLADYRGQYVLIVNTASKCGLTPQFSGLEELYKNNDNLMILGFPSDSFAHQEPNSADQAQEFCQLNYGVTFPIMDKVELNSSNEPELFKFLKKEKRGLFGMKKITWNFTKFLISPEGKVIKRFGPKDEPKKIQEYLDKLKRK